MEKTVKLLTNWKLKTVKTTSNILGTRAHKLRIDFYICILYSELEEREILFTKTRKIRKEKEELGFGLSFRHVKYEMSIKHLNIRG